MQNTTTVRELGYVPDVVPDEILSRLDIADQKNMEAGAKEVAVRISKVSAGTLIGGAVGFGTASGWHSIQGTPTTVKYPTEIMAESEAALPAILGQAIPILMPTEPIPLQHIPLVGIMFASGRRDDSSWKLKQHLEHL